MEALGINGKLLIAQAINFTLLLLVLNKFAYKPILAMLDDRKKKITDGLKAAEKSQAELQATEKKTSQLIKEARTEAKQIVDSAKTQAATEASQIVQNASNQADRILEKAKSEADTAKAKAMLEAKRELASVVTIALDKIVKNDLSESEKEKLAHRAVEEIKA